VVLDQDLRVKTANRAFYECFRTSPEEAAGKDFLRPVVETPAALEELSGRLRDVLERGEDLTDFEFSAVFRDAGRKVLVADARAIDLQDEGGRAVLVTLDDVTRRRAAESELRQSETRYRHLFENARDGIWLRDGDSLRVLDVNPALLQMFGCAREEVLGRLPWEVPAFADTEGARALFERVSEMGYSLVPELAILRRDGRRLDVELVSTGYATEGKTVIQSNFRDVTPRRRLEEELRQSQKLESIGRLAGGIAHDFNNILNIISAHASLLDRSGADSARRADGIAAIQTSVERGSAVVRQLLTFARASDAVFEPVDVNAIAEEVARLLAETLPKNVALDLALDRAVPKVPGDGNQLHQALLNLCVNARDAMPDGGRVTIRTAAAAGEELRNRLPEARPERYVCVEVADDGVGMDAETRRRLFEPFFTTKEKTGVRGLGLAVVYGIVNGHGGLIEVESERGKGSALRMYLPTMPEGGVAKKGSPPPRGASGKSGAGRGSARGPARSHRARARSASRAILLVEDEALLLDSVRGLLEHEGYRVLAAKSAAEAFELFERNADDVRLVLCDLELPDGDGFETIARMRRINPRVDAVLASGHADSRERALRKGADGFLAKPYSADALLRTARRLFGPPADHES
jgi:PAS domain S-box-containing protein